MSKLSSAKMNGLFIFRRDLRLYDNKTLLLLSQRCSRLYVAFIFTPEQTNENINKYRSSNAIQFMIECLSDLQSKLLEQGSHLYLFYGENETIVSELIELLNIDVVGFNSDYTPYAKERDARISRTCEELGVDVISEYDYYLFPPHTILTQSGTPYLKFTPYYNNALSHIHLVENPNITEIYNLSYKKIKSKNQISIRDATGMFLYTLNENLYVHGGRSEALNLLHLAKTEQHDYENTHNLLSVETTRLSAYLKFGCVSIREAYKELRGLPEIVRQLVWRDFYAQILYYYPDVLHRSIKPKYDAIVWDTNEEWFRKWKNGTTGFPIVDAGMRQLKQTGYMHNRARLITSSFLVKVLMIDWRKGEQYFAQQLIDYDPASNNGNWAWIMGGGVDSQPYFRIFNPFEQTKRYDPNCEYIKRWIPELSKTSVKNILQWDRQTTEIGNYPLPMVNYKKQKETVLGLYKKYLY